LDGVQIEDGAVIGAGAVVVSDIPKYAIAVGVPAKVVKYRFDEETTKQLMNTEWWNYSFNKLKNVAENQFNIKDFIKNH
ncbi:MAG: antibiotic acetyltransferase, partial [Bacteroidales bacterium]|nr:antibiotic acetyltransferase [Bacteroidales bacterium]